MKRFTLKLKSLSVLLALLPTVLYAQDSGFEGSGLEEIIVEASFYERSVFDTAASLSLINAETLVSRQASHLEDVLNIMPNVNFSAGASRGRFFQIRGIGERSQFVDPINPSVGLIIDGIDFTGVGGAATTLDVKQIEVLRGPQGTLYGANALAGLINIVSEDPDQQTGTARVTIGDYGTKEVSIANSYTLADNLGLRVALGQNIRDGYIENTHLNRDDTNDIDELTLRAKLHWQVSENNLLKFTTFFLDGDNGYDAFSLDNTRNTLSDEPGRDEVLTRAGAIQYVFSGFDFAEWENTLSFANSDLEYGFDEDWSFRTICPEDSDCAFFQFSTNDNYARNNDNISFDSRFVSQSDNGLSWVAGTYLRKQAVDLLRTYTNNDPNFDTFYGPVTNREITLFSSEFDTTNFALYSQLDIPLAESLTLSTGLRAERRNAEYDDSNGSVIDNDENLWGVKLALEYQGLDNQLLYALVSRGYKAGGNNVPGPTDANGDDLIPIVFDTEFMWNYELGHKAQWADGALETQVSVFYQDRDDIQVRQSLVTSQANGDINGGCPCEFTDFLGNAAAGTNYGIEFEMSAYLDDVAQVWFSLGLLESEFNDFMSFSHVEADDETGTFKDLDGRDQAHAPNYQAAMGFAVDVSDHLTWRAETEVKDAFFLSPRHEEKTKTYVLLNMRLTYAREAWEVALWGKNLTDDEVIVRGFGSFGNDPRKFYVTEPYYQFGAPRTAGVSAAIRF